MPQALATASWPKGSRLCRRWGRHETLLKMARTLLLCLLGFPAQLAWHNPHRVPPGCLLQAVQAGDCSEAVELIQASVNDTQVGLWSASGRLAGWLA